MFKDASSAEMLGGLLAGVTVSGVLMGMFQNNAGGAWDNAKKSFEKGAVINGETFYKKSEPHKASVTGDTVGDPFKDTSGPSMNILIKLMSIVSLVIAPYIAVQSGVLGKDDCCKPGMETACDMNKCITMTPEQCAAYCDSMGCTPEQKAMCMSHAGGGTTANGKDLAAVNGTIIIDNVHSFVNFGIGHMLSTAHGTLSLDTGIINLTGDLATSTMEVKVNVASINTKNEKRDEHLRSADFFDAAKYPSMSFKSTSIKTSTNPEFKYVATGNLTVKDVTKPVDLYFNYLGSLENPYSKSAVHSFEGEFSINRIEFHIGESGPMVGDDVKISINAEASPIPATPAQ
jgi:polyisoprenoid-binding protein YceI